MPVGSKLAELFCEIRADTRGLESGLSRAKGMIASFARSSVVAGLGAAARPAGRRLIPIGAPHAPYAPLSDRRGFLLRHTPTATPTSPNPSITTPAGSG